MDGASVATTPGSTSSGPSLIDRARALRAELAAFEPGLLSGDDCAALVHELARTEKACAAAAARAAARAAVCGAPARKGFADPADWLARETGSSVTSARSALDTAEALPSCPGTAEALAAGELSLSQAREITRAEKAMPGSERELLDLSGRVGLSRLRDRARTVRHQAIGADELHRRRRQARTFRHWRTDLGMVGFTGELPPEVGVPIVNRLDAECDRIRREAKRAATTTGAEIEPREAYAADALVRLLAGQGRGHATRADLVVVVDLRAWRRGHAEPGEPCHLIGGGDIPVSLARELGRDAFLKAVLHDGVAIHTVTHLGRHRPAELETALDLGAPPGFEGVTCADEGCDRRHGLEWDHVDPVANDGPTSYANLAPRCWPHHQEKTRRDRAAGLLDRRRPRGEGRDHGTAGPDPP